MLEKGIIASNLKSTTNLTSTTSYTSEHSTKENLNLFTSDYDIFRGTNERNKWFDFLMKQKHEKKDVKSNGQESNLVDILPINMKELNDDVKLLMDFIGYKEKGKTVLLLY